MFAPPAAPAQNPSLAEPSADKADARKPGKTVLG